MASLESPLAAGTHSKEGKHLKAKNHESCCPVASFPFAEKKGLATSAKYVLRWYPKKTMSSVRPCMGKQRSGVLIRSEREGRCRLTWFHLHKIGVTESDKCISLTFRYMIQFQT